MKTRANALGGKIIGEAKKLNIPIEPSAYHYDNLALAKNPIAIIGLNETLYDANNGEEVAPEEFLTRITTCDSEGKDEVTANATKSDGGGGKNYYDLPPNPTQLLDLIEYRNMNGNIKDIFKACYRLGQKDGISEEYDLRKMALYSLRELGRVTGRKDYLVLADEVIGHHDITGAEVKVGRASYKVHGNLFTKEQLLSAGWTEVQINSLERVK